MSFSRSTSAPHPSGRPLPAKSTHGAVTELPSICWGAQTLSQRGIVRPFHLNGLDPAPYNAIGTHRGTGWSGNAINEAIQTLPHVLSKAGTSHQASHAPDQEFQHYDANLTTLITPHSGWFGANSPVSLDPFGAGPLRADAPTTIAIANTHLQWLELNNAIEHGWLEADGQILKANGHLQVTRIAISPVWYLPGVAERLQVDESQLRQALYKSTDGLFPDLITRPELSVFLPPLAETLVDILGPATALRSGKDMLAVHIDSRYESASDDITAHAGWIHGLETCIEIAQAGGVSVMIGLAPYARTAHPPHRLPSSNMPDLDWELKLVPDVLRWLGIRHIDQLLSMSYDCSDQLTRAGVEIDQQVITLGDIETPDWVSDYSPAQREWSSW